MPVGACSAPARQNPRMMAPGGSAWVAAGRENGAGSQRGTVCPEAHSLAGVGPAKGPRPAPAAPRQKAHLSRRHFCTFPHRSLPAKCQAPHYASHGTEATAQDSHQSGSTHTDHKTETRTAGKQQPF